MAVFKCKMCGGSLEVEEGKTVCECEYCGTEQTLPSIHEEEIQNLFNRANVLRMKAEFDKAEALYERIIQHNPNEAEAYWGLILCRYGIEYVEDPATNKRIPTCHRASYDSVTADEDYKNALRLADATQKAIYETEAALINEIQSGILSLAQKEDPYDVFICYKETGEDGKRTQDSAIANDIYHQLTNEGFKVFYAAITLEDKIGRDYEPYIFSALNTAKVMLVLGTKPEYFNAVWVKNEWSRFQKIMKKERDRLLIPCYKDMDPYELPEEFSHLQAQDMGKIGFINDLIRGIKKIITIEKDQQATKKVETEQPIVFNTSSNAQLKRGYMALEDHEWEKAEDFFEETLNLDPECAEAYLGKLLARDHKSGFESWIAAQKDKYIDGSQETLMACQEDSGHILQMVQDCKVEGYLSESSISEAYEFDLEYKSAHSSRVKQKANQMWELESDPLLSRARQFAKGELDDKLENGISEIRFQLDQRIASEQAKDEVSIDAVKKAYAENIETTDQRVKQLMEDALVRREADYQNAIVKKNNANDINAYRDAMNALSLLKGYRDSDNLAEVCQNRINEIEEAEAKRNKIEKFIGWMIICLLAIGCSILWKINEHKKMIQEQERIQEEITITRQKIMSLLELGCYDQAMDALNESEYEISKDQYYIIRAAEYLSVLTSNEEYALSDYYSYYKSFYKICERENVLEDEWVFLLEELGQNKYVKTYESLIGTYKKEWSDGEKYIQYDINEEGVYYKDSEGHQVKGKLMKDGDRYYVKRKYYGSEEDVCLYIMEFGYDLTNFEKGINLVRFDDRYGYDNYIQEHDYNEEKREYQKNKSYKRVNDK